MRALTFLTALTLLAGCAAQPSPFQVQYAPHHNAGADNNTSNGSGVWVDQINAGHQAAGVSQKQKYDLGVHQGAAVSQKDKQRNEYWRWTDQSNTYVSQKSKASVLDFGY